MKHGIAAWLALLSLCSVCGAQTLHRQWGQNFKTFQLNGKTLTGHQHRSDEFGSEDSDFTVDISALDLDATRLDSAGGYFGFLCKANVSCVQYSSHQCSANPSCQSYFTSESTPEYYIDDEASRQECEDFLKAVRAAANSTQCTANRDTGAPPEPSHQDEPAINGNNIPSSISFDQKQHELDEFQKRTVAKLEENRANNYKDSAVKPEPISTLFDSVPDVFDSNDSDSSQDDAAETAQPFTFIANGLQRISDPPQSASQWWTDNADKITEKLEVLSAGFYDEVREKYGEGEALHPVEYTVQESVSDWYSDYVLNMNSKLLFGKRFDDMPEMFQKDMNMLKQTFERLNPWSLKAGFEQVNAMGDIFDLWNEGPSKSEN